MSSTQVEILYIIKRLDEWSKELGSANSRISISIIKEKKWPALNSMPGKKNSSSRDMKSKPCKIKSKNKALIRKLPLLALRYVKVSPKCKLPLEE